jgi:hypothetical protein
MTATSTVFGWGTIISWWWFSQGQWQNQGLFLLCVPAGAELVFFDETGGVGEVPLVWLPH